MSNAYLIFCPECNELILDAAACPRCHWSRPPAAADLGKKLADPLTLGRAVSGQPAAFAHHIWYAAPPEERDTPGMLVQFHRSGRAAAHKALPGEGGLPVAVSLTGDKQYLYLGLLDYALGSGRPTKSVLALDPTTGEVMRQIATPSRELTAPTRDNGRLYCAAASPEAVYALDMAQSKVIWTADVQADFRYRPAVSKESVVVVGGSMMGPGLLIGLDKRDGRQLWQHENSRGFSQPVAATPAADAAADAVYVGAGKEIRAYAAASGELLWRYHDFRPSSAGAATAPPTVSSDLLLLPTGVFHEPDGRPGYALQAVNRISGKQVWQFVIPGKEAAHILVSPFIAGESVIIGDRQGRVYALELASGRLQWQADLERRLTAVPVIDGDGLLLPTRDGLLHRRRWRAASPLPQAAPAVYEQRGDWLTAAAAHALAQPPNFAAAGQALLQANRPEQALILFERSGDTAGRAAALAALGKYDQAVEIGRETADKSQLAEWLAQAKRFDEAAELFAELGQYDRAGKMYEEAQRPLRAIEAYKEAGLQKEVDRLGDKIDLSDESLVTRLKAAMGWEKLVNRYRQAGHWAAAADVLEENERWADALELRRQLKDWARVREICRQTNDWRGEAEACKQLAQKATSQAEIARWEYKAGELYEGHKQWEEALSSYRAAGHIGKQAAVLARHRQFLAAAQLMAEAREAADAASYYEKVAEAELDSLSPWERDRFQETIAGYYEEAARWYKYAGQVGDWQRCLVEADLYRRRPRLILTQAILDKPFQQGATTMVTITLRNNGFGPAAQIQICTGGHALKRAEPELARSLGDLVIASQTSTQIDLPIEPQAYSQEDSALPFELVFRYNDPLSEEEREDGPFAFYQIVAASFAQLSSSGTVTINQFYNQGNLYYAGESQVNIRPGGGGHAAAGGDQINLGAYGTAAPTSPPPTAENGVCPHCGVVLGGAIRFCDQCGKPVASRKPNNSSISPINLRQFLITHFSETELRTLCFDLKVDHEVLGGHNKEDIAREIVAYFQRRGRLGELTAYCRDQRPGNELWE